MLALNLESLALKNGIKVSTEPMRVPRSFVLMLSLRANPVDGGTELLDDRLDGL
jgi:hypothetical protein